MNYSTTQTVWTPEWSCDGGLDCAALTGLSRRLVLCEDVWGGAALSLSLNALLLNEVGDLVFLLSNANFSKPEM